MPKLGPLELVVILLVVLVLFGPKNLPKLGSALGASVRNLREGMNSSKDTSATTAQAEATPAVEAAGTSAAAVETVAAKPAPKHTEAKPVEVR